ncbi:MAG: TolC family protein [Aliishimia sp.]
MSLTACLGEGTGDGFVSRATAQDPTPNIKSRKNKLTTQKKINAESAVIQSLVSRKSALPTGSAYDEVASAVLAANARTAESDLRAAKLRAEAASKNWLPRIGPEISLTSLSRIVASLVLDVTLFDHGRKKGEREFAKADVEVAAVTLAEDSNERVLTGLELYVAAQEGREKAQLDEATLKQMNHFQYIISERVRGGVSDLSDLNVIRQKVAEIRSSYARNNEAARTAFAELNAMAAHPLDEVSGVSRVDVSPGAVKPLAVVMAEATRGRAIAQAKVDRANQLPGLVASARVGDNSGASVSSDGTLGLGTGAQLRAIEAAKEAADRQVAQSTEDSNRTLRRLESVIAAKERQAAEAADLTRAAKSNLDLFQEQFDAGQRQVLDVVQVYETFARQQESEISLKYEAALSRLELARVLGILADGEAI